MSNYPEHFGLKQRVFKRDNQAFLYVTDQMRQAEQEFRTAFDESDCVLTVSGPIGSGKTTVVNHALAGLPGETRAIRLGRVRLAPDEVLELLLTELGVAEPPSGTIRKLGALGTKVAQLKSDNTRVVVVVEDASRTGIDTLGELEVICGSDGGFDIGLIVCGDETLPKLLKDEHLRRLAQRVSASVIVAPLAVDEMEDYLLSAIRGAGGDPSRILSNDVPALLHILSCGVPRLANKLVEAALKKVAAQSGPRVTCALLADIAENQFGITTEIPVKRRPPPVTAKVTSSKPDRSSAPSSSNTTSNGPSARVDLDDRKDARHPVSGAKPQAVAKPGKAHPGRNEAQAGVEPRNESSPHGEADSIAAPGEEPSLRKQAEPVVKPADEPSLREDPDSVEPKTTAPAVADRSAQPEADAGARPTADSRGGSGKADDDLPYLIQDTQPELAALKPESLGNDPSIASEPEHEMLPDLDELAAELAASNPAPPAVSEIPELNDIPELGVETLADDAVAGASESGPAEKAEVAADLTDATDAVRSSQTEPGVPLVDDAPELTAAKAEPEVPEIKAKPEMPELTVDADVPEAEARPDVRAADRVHEVRGVRADTDPPEVKSEPEIPELKADSLPPPTQRDEIAEATPDEAALISALADEHATTQREDEVAVSIDATMAKAVDETPANTPTAGNAPQNSIDNPGDDVRVAAAPTRDTIDLSVAPSAEADTSPANGEAIVMPEPELETVAALDDEAANGDQDPSLKLEVLEDDAVKAQKQQTEGEVVVHDADRDPTLAQLKPDLDALELALAENFVPDGADNKDGEESASAEPVPKITLDNSIEKKVTAEAEDLAKREAEIAARKKAAEEKALPKSRSGPSDTDVHKLAAELKRANTLEDMDDRLAETLFGDEINMVAAQVLESAREQAENANETDALKATTPTAGDDAKLRKQFEDVWGEVPDESEAIDLKSIKPNSGLDMSASQRLATVRALNAGMKAPPQSPAPTKPAKPKDAPVPIEDQIDISMTNTMKALNIDPKVLEQPPEADEAPKGGFFSRFRKKG